MPRGVTGRRVETRARLLAAAADSFADRGFHGTSIEMICERAGFTRGAFYSNFGSKDELFFALFDERADAVVGWLRDALATAAHSDQPIHAFAASTSRTVDGDRRWYLITTEFTLHAIRNREAAAVLARHDALIRKEIAAVLVELLELAGREPTVDPSLVARFAIALREGGDAQSFVEEAEGVEARIMERLFLPSVLETFSRPKVAVAAPSAARA